LHQTPDLQHCFDFYLNEQLQRCSKVRIAVGENIQVLWWKGPSLDQESVSNKNNYINNIIKKYILNINKFVFKMNFETMNKYIF
jgi:hypothetical protein